LVQSFPRHSSHKLIFVNQINLQSAGDWDRGLAMTENEMVPNPDFVPCGYKISGFADIKLIHSLLDDALANHSGTLKIEIAPAPEVSFEDYRYVIEKRI